MTPLQREVLAVLAQADRPLTPNEIGNTVVARGHVTIRQPRGKGGGQLSTGSVIGYLLGKMVRAGLIELRTRTDGLSGTAYVITGLGREALQEYADRGVVGFLDAEHRERFRWATPEEEASGS